MADTVTNAALNQNLSERLSAVLPPAEFYTHASPILVMLIGSMVALLAGVFRSDPEKPSMTAYGIGLVTCIGASFAPIFLSLSGSASYLSSGFVIDGISRFAFLIVSIGTLFTMLVASNTQMGRNLLRSEMVSLLLFSSAGMMIMVSAGEFMSFFTGLELMSVPMYVMVGYQRRDYRGLEAAIKYFILGSSASAILLLGMALLYMHTGSVRWENLTALPISLDAPFVIVGTVLFFGGIVFKLGLVPFHMWVPDVYQGAGSVLTGYMASLVKACVALTLLRILSIGFQSPSGVLLGIFWVLGAASIIVGSLFGLAHNSVKRMLAYSSIANAGYFCLAFAVLAVNPQSVIAKQALLAYTAIYAILTLGSFAVLSWIEDGNREDLLKEELAGLGNQKPFAAFAFTVFLFGLAGIPPVAGFFGKFLLINSAVSIGLVGLAVVLVLFSCISLYYYLSIMVEMWLKPASRNSVIVVDGNEGRRFRVLIGVALVASLLIGVFGPRWAMKASPEVMTKGASLTKPNFSR